MNRTSLIIAVVLVLGVSGVGAFALMNRTDSSMVKPEVMEKPEIMVDDDLAGMAETEQESMAKEDVMIDVDNEKVMMKQGKYTPFSPEVLTSSVNTRRVLFFYANWCSTCKPADASFSANLTKIPADVTLIRVNYNDTETDSAEKELAKKYGVTYQHTFVQIDADGNEVTKWNGGQIDELLSNLK